MKIQHPVRTAWNLLVAKAPVEAQVIITRRCNLSCGYCSEYDKTSAAVPFETLKERIDALHRLRTASITLLGGEPLLHPQLSELVAYVRRKSVASVITNGFLLTDAIIDELNAAGLDHMQVSVDALAPTEDLFIQKSFRSVRGRLEALVARAEFSVHVNAVLCPQSVGDFLKVVEEVDRLGIPISVGLVHDSDGRVAIHGEPYRSTWEQAHEQSGSFLAFEREYGARLLDGETPDWHCRAGARYLYVDEFGRVQFCASQRGRLDKDVTEYTASDVAYWRKRKKGCESGCSIGCAFRCSAVDNQPGTIASQWFRKGRRFAQRPGAASGPDAVSPRPR